MTKGSSNDDAAVSALDADARTKSTGSGASTQDVAPSREVAAVEASRDPILRSGTRVERYVLMDIVGSGGMGVVYRAFDTKLRRTVALKLHYRGSVQRRTQTRMLREAEGLARLTHPNVVTVYDTGTFEGGVYIAMELVEGQTLDQWLKSAPRSTRERLDVLVQAGQGLAAAHEAGLVHRDFKPENVLIDATGRVRVIDFGLVKADADVSNDGEVTVDADVPSDRDEAAARRAATAQAAFRPGETRGEPPAPRDEVDASGEAGADASLFDARLTRVGARIGTLLYMSPEQRLGEVVNQASDQFSFCVTCFEAFTGELPFPLLPEEEFFGAVVTGQVTKTRAGLPRALRESILRGLAFDPTHRHASLKSLLEEIVPRNKGRMAALLAIAVTSLVTAIGLSLSVADRDFERCADGSGVAREMWAPQDAEQVNHRFRVVAGAHGEATATRLNERMNALVASYSEEHIAACRATHAEHVQSEQLLDARMACLQRAHATTKLLTRAWREADLDAVDSASSAVTRLEGMVRCEGVEEGGAGTRAPDGVSRVQYDAWMQRFDRGAALRLVGKYSEAERELSELFAEVAEIDSPVLTARIGSALGEVLTVMNEFARGDRVLRDAIRDASLAGLESLALKTATVRADLLASSGQRTAARVLLETVRWRMHDRPKYAALEFDAAISAGWIYNEEEKYSEADREYEAATRLMHAADAVAIASLKSYLSELRINQGRPEEALVLAREAYEKTRDALGDEHPSTVVFLTYLALAERGVGRLADARAHMAFVLEVDIRRFGESHRDIAIDYDVLSQIARDAGEYEDALHFARRAYEVRKGVYGAESPSTLAQNVAAAEAALGQTQVARARFRETVADLRRAAAPPSDLKPALEAFALFEVGQHNWDAAQPLATEVHELAQALYGEAHQEVVSACRILTELALGQERPDEAVRWAEQAFSAMPPNERLKAEDQAALYFNLARALHGRDGAKVQERVNELVSTALALLREPKFASEARLRDEIIRFREALAGSRTSPT